MYQNEIIAKSAALVAQKREYNASLEPKRLTAEEKDDVLKKFHPDHIESQFKEIVIGPNKGEKAPLELVDLLQGKPKLLSENFSGCILKDTVDLSKPDYETDVVIICGG